MHSKRRTFRTLAIAATLLAASAASHGDARAGDAPRAIDAIENDLVADDASVRAKAAAELTDRFPDGAVAVPMLVDLLDDEDPSVVAASAKAIDSMAVAGAGPLAAWCADKSHMGAETPFAKLSTMAGGMAWFDASDLLAPSIDGVGGPPDPCAFAAAALMDHLNVSMGREVMSRLTTLVRTVPSESRAIAAAALAWIGADSVASKGIASADDPAHAKAVKSAEDLLKTEGDLRSWAAARMLRTLRPTDAASIAVMTNALLPPNRVPRFGPPDELRVGDRNDSLMDALGRAGPKGASAAPKLVAFLVAPDVRPSAVEALIDIGKEADVVSLLAQKPHDSQTIARVLAERRRAPSAALPVLLDDAKISAPLARYVAEFGPVGASALPRLREMLAAARGSHASDAVDYASAILAIAPGDADATAFLTGVHDDPKVGSVACNALVMRGPLTPDAVRMISGLLKFDREPFRVQFTWRALTDIGRRGPEAKELVGSIVRLANAVNDDRAKMTGSGPPSIDLRHAIAVALGRVGADDAASMAILREWRDTGDETIRVPAAQALRRIRAKK